MTELYRTTYDRAGCAIGVVHLGFGAFHRAHQAMYLDDVMEATGDLRWGIAAVNLRAAESAAFAQNGSARDGYVLKAAPPDGAAEWRRVRSHVHFADWREDAEEAEALLALESVHMVTITVTESGYYTDDTGALDASESVIAEELRGGAKRSVYAYLAGGLRRRMQAGGAPLTICCCDNIRQNGHMLQRNLMAWLELAGQRDLAAWLADNATFPCSMVDRITPRSTAALAAEAETLFGPLRAQPILAETFVQWVLEDDFAGPMPDLAQAGVTVTADVDPYEETKIRILNGGHTGVTYLAALQGLATFDQAMADPGLRAHFDAFELDEVLPALTIDLPFDKDSYLEAIAGRFSNASIADSVERICADGFAKHPIFIRPTLEGCLAQGILPRNGLRGIAGWYVFARHHAAGALRIGYAEPNWDRLAPMLTRAGRDAFLTSDLLWAGLPRQYPDFPAALSAAIDDMERLWPV